MKAAISIEGISKQYRLGSEQIAGQSFREMVMGSITSPLRRFRRLAGRDQSQEMFWALKDITFDVQPGEVVGIIGRNGAGKSTLLKILSRITSPTEGKIRYRGKLASLLEVGTGFHPELTGRENIFLNGAILGMTRAEITTRFDEIVEFAGIEQFVDTPVKRYSSGMYVRLAFSVAAHLDPDVLIVDEVLAVGDVSFQKKCIGKMKMVSDAGMTVLFVSHNMTTISTLCQNGVFLKDGKIELTGEINGVIEAYTSTSANHKLHSNLASESDKFSVVNIEIIRESENQRFAISGDQLKFLVTVNSEIAVSSVRFQIGLYDLLDRRICVLDSNVLNQNLDIQAGINRVYCTIPRLPLFPGKYLINLSIHDEQKQLYGVMNCLEIDVFGSNYYESGLLPANGPILMDHQWEIQH